MPRRKRIIYDPPGQRKRRRRTDNANGSQLFLSRRMLIAKSGIVAIFGGLAGRLGYLQLVKGEDYRLQADDNVYHDEVLPPPRGLIFDRLGRPLARNRRSWEVRVVKADLPTDEDERRRVLDMLISALQTEDVLAIRPSAVPGGSTETVLGRVATMLGLDEAQSRQEIARWTARWGDRLVKVQPVSIDEAAFFRAHAADLPGVLVMNEVDYLVGNVWAPRLPITIKTDVPRPVALIIEANSIYMPGVMVDDTSLSREYLGGQVMSHVVGYVQRIDPASLDDLRNRNEHNERIYSQNDIIGREGLEQALEPDLRGIKGKQVVEVDAAGVVMRVVPNSVVEPTPGANVKLTIDLELQTAMGVAIEQAVALAAEGKQKDNIERGREGKRLWQIPNAGTAVATDPRTGEVLAMVSYPYYDNQLFITGISARKWNDYINLTKGKAFLNRAIHELYPPGSTFKIFLAASALSHGTVTPDETHSCRGAIRVPDRDNLNTGLTMACWTGWSNGEHGTLNLYEAIEQSCDVYFYNVAQDYIKPIEAFDAIYYWDWNLLAGELISSTKHTFNGLGIELLAQDMQEKFWFGRATGIEILEEAIGLFPDPVWKQENIEGGEGWSVGDTLNVSIGQGEVKATPLQITMNSAALASGGSYKRPHLVREIRHDGQEWEATPIEELGNLDIDQPHLDVVIEGMRRVVHETLGTAHRTKIDDGVFTTKWPLTNPEGEEEIIIAGKTGTAEFGVEDDLGARDTHAWFTCFAPLDEPEIAVSVVIEAGGEGATYAVPVADAVLRAYFEMSGRRPRGTVLSTTPLAVPDENGVMPEASPAAPSSIASPVVSSDAGD